MNILRLVATGTVLLIIGGCADGGNTLGPAAPPLSVEDQSSERRALAARRIQTSGDFDAIVDFSTLTLTPKGRNCLLQVDGRLVFTGTIEGEATGQTSALVFAPCADVATSPPGTYRDVFKSELMFEGTVDGEAASANVLYVGGVEPGGQINGRLIFSNGVQGSLEVEAVVAVGGEYHGSVVVN
jgi:hypothetical protein